MITSCLVFCIQITLGNVFLSIKYFGVPRYFLGRRNRRYFFPNVTNLKIFSIICFCHFAKLILPNGECLINLGLVVLFGELRCKYFRVSIELSQ